MKKISVSRDLNNFTYSIRGRIRFNSTGSRARTRNDRKNKSHVYLRNQSLEDSFRCCSKPTAKSWRLSSLVSFFLFSGSRSIDPCASKYCGIGKECELSPNSTIAVCVCMRKCPRRHRPVCASNGKIYANHCELHRAACHSGSSLTKSRLMRCLHHGKN